MTIRLPTPNTIVGTITIGVADTAALSLHVRFVRPRLLSWGAARDEIERLMVGDEVCARPQFNATRAVTIRARPKKIWPWLVQIGFGRAGWYSYDPLDNLGHHSSEQIIPEFQHLSVGDWVPMGGKVTPYKANLVTKMEPNRLMLWEKGGGTWLWLLEPVDAGHMRLITRMRGRYGWSKPTIAIELILMELGDPFMMRRCLLGIKRRAEMLAAERQSFVITGRPGTPEVVISDGHGSHEPPDRIRGLAASPNADLRCKPCSVQPWLLIPQAGM
jgi:hypothetical protein